MLGGFLGAGKTTTIARLAERYVRDGRNVAVVTNDKAADSVDTLRLRALGLNVGELPGACFCGNVDELIEMEDTEADALIDMGAAIEASQDQQEQDKDDQPKKPSRKK